jgi:hypothetical protein
MEETRVPGLSIAVVRQWNKYSGAGVFGVRALRIEGHRIDDDTSLQRDPVSVKQNGFFAYAVD